ncbi:MAG: ankyrin repeat domain-containing protein [Pseudomonadota bacterium]
MARKDRIDHGPNPSDDPSCKELREIEEFLARGDTDQLEFASQLVDSFPYEQDGYHGDPWMVHAVSSGRLNSVKWMIAKGVDPNPKVDDGYPPILTCLELRSPEKHQILAALIAAGADIGAQGINGWTPLHMAAIRDDEISIRMLLEAGADRTITTGIDDDATAEQEARTLGHWTSAEIIARFGS